MKVIKLTKMVLQNFKGAQSATYEFSDNTDIVGGNATGKSTIYEAYLWCLFDKNQHGNTPKVQPLDEHNEVRHKLTTSVKMWFDIDGNPFIVERSLKENWTKPRGTTEVVLQGTTSEYAVNEVPLTKTQFTQKLAEILPLDKWFIISNIAIIPALDQKTCRAALQDIAPKIDERVIAEQFPAVEEAFAKGVTLEEFSAGVRKGKQVAKTELDGIPAAIEAQDRLRVDDDFAAIEVQIEKIEIDIKNRQIELERVQQPTINEEDIKRLDDMHSKLQLVQKAIYARTQTAIASERNERQAVESNIDRCMREVEQINNRISMDNAIIATCQQDIERYKKQIADLRSEWVSENGKQYQEPALSTVCPTCGQTLPQEHIQQAQQKAQEQWNVAKVKTLQTIQADAERYKTRINELLKQVEQKQQNNYTERLAELKSLIEEQRLEESKIKDSVERLNADAEYQKLIKEENELKQTLDQQVQLRNSNDNTELINTIKADIGSMSAERDALNKRLAGKEQNRRIDQERNRLEKREQELAQMIADYEYYESQITAFRKAKITAVEESVSSLFTMVRWKMYEQNITNDGEKEICQAIIAGVPYEQQNRATQVNAGVDIVNAFATAYQVSVPLFIDNAESVEQTIPTNGQKITLTVKAGAKLNIINN